MVHVPECETGRVYLLKFKSSSQKLFFWMQNANDEKDKENVDRVNKLINDLQSALNDQHGRSGRAGGDDDDSTADVLSLLGSSGQGKGFIRWWRCIWIVVAYYVTWFFFLFFFFFKRAGIDTRTNLPIFTIGWRCGVSSIGLTGWIGLRAMLTHPSLSSVTLSSDGDDHATVTITARETASDVPALDSDLLRALKEVVSGKSVSGKLEALLTLKGRNLYG